MFISIDEALFAETLRLTGRIYGEKPRPIAVKQLAAIKNAVAQRCFYFQGTNEQVVEAFVRVLAGHDYRLTVFPDSLPGVYEVEGAEPLIAAASPPTRGTENARAIALATAELSNVPLGRDKCYARLFGTKNERAPHLAGHTWATKWSPGRFKNDVWPFVERPNPGRPGRKKAAR